jgi:lipopolysaccharide transport system ATP-binding protein
VPAAELPVIEVERLGRCFDVFPGESVRGRHAVWDLAAGLPGPLGRVAARRRDRLGQRFWALREVSFAVGRGECVGVIGANGSGKSTLLHLLCDTLAPSEGHARIRGRVGALLELGTGFVGDLTGRENVALSGLLHGLSPADTARRFDAIAAFADIGAFIDQPVKTYSSGMYVRLAFALMAHIDADVLVIDEALAVGDVFFVHRCLAHLEAFRAAGGTLLFVSHDIAAVQRLCTRVLWLDHGVLRGEGSPREMTERYLEGIFETQRAQPARSGTRPSPPPAAGEDVQTPAAAGAEPRGAGAGGARIEHVGLTDAAGRMVHAVVGGEAVDLEVRARAGQALAAPIIGFYLKDRLGQHLFGENTLAATTRLPAAAGALLTARFQFTMPRLYPGEYLIVVAVAEGTQAHHVQHHWLHDAWHLVSHWPGEATGLVGIEVAVSLEVAADR